MGPRRNYYIVSIFSCFLLFCFFEFENLHLKYNSPKIEMEESSDGQLNSSFPITFYHNAYVDLRYEIPRLRIFSFNGCIKKDNFLMVDVFYEGVEKPTRLKVFGGPLDGKCPSAYAPAKPCFYVAHTFHSDLLASGGVQKVMIHLEHRKVTLSVKLVDKRYETGLTMCLQPVYYYSQWQNIVLYIEAWKAQGATRFIVFYHSATKETRQVIDYYRNQGIIELRSWPNMGNLPNPIRDQYPRIDDSVFIFGYFLAMNICVLDIKTTIGCVADFDEVIVPRNGTMLDYALKEMKGTKVGALRFGNNYVSMNPSIYTSNFSGVASPVFVKRNGPPKYVFNASVIDILNVHWPEKFIQKDTITKSGNGALLHLRFEIGKDAEVAPEKPFGFFPNNSSSHIENMHKTASLIFNGSIPIFNPELYEGLQRCVIKIKQKKNVCRSTSGLCKSEMDKLSEWVYDKSEGVFISEDN